MWSKALDQSPTGNSVRRNATPLRRRATRPKPNARCGSVVGRLIRFSEDASNIQARHDFKIIENVPIVRNRG
jgi:hypothetical protein